MEKLKIETYKKGIVLPYMRDLKGTVGLGGVIDDNGEFVETSYCHGGRYEQGGYYGWDKATLVCLDEKVVYFGYFLPHWGHFLIDCLGRMWPFAEIDNNLVEYKIAFISQQPYFYPNCYEFFEALGISRERILWVGIPTRFSEVLVPQMSYTPEPRRLFYPEYTNLFNHVVEAILSCTSKSKVETKCGQIDKVYFTRSFFNNAKIREVGLKVIDNVMINGGFNILAPERLSLAEQVVIWNYAEQIVCVNGTIPLNCIFRCCNSSLLCGGG